MNQGNLQCVLSTMVSLYTYNGLQAAIEYTYEMYYNEASQAKTKQALKKGLKKISELTEEKDVVAICLKTYDLDFGRFVLLTFGYSPQLTSTLLEDCANSSSEYERRFKISNFVCDYKTSMMYYASHLLQSHREQNEDSFNQLIEYAKAHSQHETLYDFLKQFHKSIPFLYEKLGEHFESLDQKVKAAEAYAKGNEFEKALVMYTDLCKGKKAMKMIKKMEIPVTQKLKKLESLAAYLYKEGFLDAACKVYRKLYYSQEVVSLVHAHSFAKAKELADKLCPDMRKYVKAESKTYAGKTFGICSSTIRLVLELIDRVTAIKNDEDEISEDYEINLLNNSTKINPAVPYEHIYLTEIIDKILTKMCKIKRTVDQIAFNQITYNQELRIDNIKDICDRIMLLFRQYVDKMWFSGLNIPQNFYKEHCNKCQIQLFVQFI